MSTISFDFRYALRSLRRSPGFAGLAVLILGLGIGVVTALFGMVDAVLLRPLPFHEPQRLVEIFGEDDTRGGMRVPAEIVDVLRARATTLAALTVHGPMGGALRTTDGLISVRGDRAWSNFNQLFGVRPALGRGFVAADEQPGAAPVMLVSHGFWRTYLGGDSAAVGSALQLDSMTYTVIGVMPASFHTAFRGTTAEHFWTPHVSAQLRAFEQEEGYELIGRLAPHATVDQARRELSSLAAGVRVAAWEAESRRIGIRALADEVVGDSARVLKLMFAAVALVLLVICANLALLLLARADKRLAEFATRKAIGASAPQLLRLALAESLLLSLIGGAVGVAFAYWLLPILIGLAPAEIPRIATAAIDARVVAVAVIITAITACAFGVVPALRLARIPVTHAMKRSGARVTSATAALRGGLVLGQVAAAVVLSILAGLVGRTFLTLMPAHPGFAPESLSAYAVYMDPRLYREPSERYQRLVQLVARLQAIPGVADVGLAQNVPFSGDDFLTPARAADRADAVELSVERRAISPNYFELLRIPLLAGRVFTATDDAAAPRVAIVNRTFARQLDPNGDVLGRLVRVSRSPDAPPLEIVGIAADVRSRGHTLDIGGEVYVPYAQTSPSIAFVVVRSSLSPLEVSSAMRRELRAVAPALPLRPEQQALSIPQLVDRSLAEPRFLATLSAAFSAAAMMLAAIGVFGMVAYSVAQRRREFAIRAALGARSSDLALRTLARVTAFSIAGIGVGVLAAAYLTRFVEAQLYAVARLDAMTFAFAASLMLLVAVLAAAVPVRRAAAVTPMSVLREE